VITDLKQQKFGVEIEFTGITRCEAISVVAEYFGTQYTFNGGRLFAYSTPDTVNRIYKVVGDSSIEAQKEVNGSIEPALSEYKCELVTPPLVYKDIEDLQCIIENISKKGGFVNSSCGIHVHIDAVNHTSASLKNILNIVISKQDMLFKALGVEQCREKFCNKLEEDLVYLINITKNTNLDMKLIEYVWYSGYENEKRNDHNNQSRHHIVNLHSFFTKGTLEFRCFNSTFHTGKVKAYIQLCLAISFQAIRQKKSSSKNTISTNEKYTFRTWLIRLGLNGEEYKTCRELLLAGLDGNIAWRNEKK